MFIHATLGIPRLPFAIRTDKSPRDEATTGSLQCRNRRWRDLSPVPNLFMNSFHFREGWKYYTSFSLRTSFLRFWLARIACAYTSARSIGFCAIWVCISSSSRRGTEVRGIELMLLYSRIVGDGERGRACCVALGAWCLLGEGWGVFPKMCS